MKSEPAVLIAAIMAVLGVAVGFGLHVTVQQLTLINTALIAIGAWWTRSQVSPAVDK